MKKFEMNYYDRKFGQIEINKNASDYDAKVEAARKLALPEEAIVLKSVPVYDQNSVIASV